MQRLHRASDHGNTIFKLWMQRGRGTEAMMHRNKIDKISGNKFSKSEKYRLMESEGENLRNTFNRFREMQMQPLYWNSEGRDESNDAQCISGHSLNLGKENVMGIDFQIISCMILAKYFQPYYYIIIRWCNNFPFGLLMLEQFVAGKTPLKSIRLQLLLTE